MPGHLRRILDLVTATSDAPPRQLAPLNPLQQLKAGHLPRRLVQLYVGLTLYGASMGLMIQGNLGLDPWDVFHSGIVKHLPFSFGTVVIAMSFVVLLAWIPLRQWPGLGTIANAIVIGVSIDVTLALLGRHHPLAVDITFMLLGVAVVALGSALYLGAYLGPGPRDGLMTGLHRRTGRSIAAIRTTLEVAAAAIGFALGGTFGIGTIWFALAIGPAVAVALKLVGARDLHAL
jgi:uncharacterized membrane protein YczE